jgi:hypothetical protein
MSLNHIAAIAAAAGAIGAGLASAPAHAYVCNPIDECDTIDLPVDPTGNCRVSVHAIVDYGDASGTLCVVFGPR